MLAGIQLALVAALPLAAAQFVPPPQDLITKRGYAGINVRYKQVPNGICETNPRVKSFAGYADVAEDRHIHFWFFEAREVDPLKAPLASWINGGPGASSMIGLFQELGPCGVDANGKVYNNPFSWTTNRYVPELEKALWLNPLSSNMIFIDQPATTGFSYTKPMPGYLGDIPGEITPLKNKTCPKGEEGHCGTFSSTNYHLVPNSTLAAAPDFWKTLQGFMGAFPQYSRNGFHFATESYGGHFGPVFNEYIEQQNANLSADAKEIHLESVMIGDGWYDPAVQYASYYNFTVHPGNTYDFRPFNQTIEDQMYNAIYGKGNCLDRLARCKATGNNIVCSQADGYCGEQVEALYDAVTGRDEYDLRELEPDPFPPNFYVDYLNTLEVQKAVGAYTNYSTFSVTASAAFTFTGDDAREEMTIEDVRKLVAQGIYVVSYVGDADYVCNWIGNSVVADLVDAPGYAQAGYANLSTADDIVHGQVRQAGKYAFVRIYLSGHEVPFYQPLAARALFDRVIAGRDLQTGTQAVTPRLRTVGPSKSTYREGNSTIQYKVLPANSTYNTTTGEPNPP